MPLKSFAKVWKSAVTVAIEKSHIEVLIIFLVSLIKIGKILLTSMGLFPGNFFYDKKMFLLIAFKTILFPADTPLRSSGFVEFCPQADCHFSQLYSCLCVDFSSPL